MEALLKLKSVLCDQEGSVCIAGSEEDRRIIQEALTELEAARAEIERLENQVQARDAELWGRTQKILQLEQQLAAKQANGGAMSHLLLSAQGGEDWPSSDEQREPRPPSISLQLKAGAHQMNGDMSQPD